MLNEIIIALIGLGGSALGSLNGIAANSKLTNYRRQQPTEPLEMEVAE